MGGQTLHLEKSVNSETNQPAASPVPNSVSPSSAPGGSFWSRNSRVLVRLLLVAIIIAAAVIYSQSQVAPVSPSNNAQTSNNSSLPDVKVTTGTEKGATVRVSGEQFTVVAEKGNGYTHLARKALAEYLKTNDPQGLQAEHKIFIEDYLQKKISNKKSIHVGDEVNFSQSDIQDAVTTALQLTDRQIQNLHQYTTRVANL